MDTNRPIPAAQYLRMSTEHQQYSLENQATTIRQYAERHGFTIVKTYADSGKSGVVLKNRNALKNLLQDVVSGEADFRAILAYDVSRWGRFQNTDEAAHYEFICTSAGVPVHYCAEQFPNDGSMPSLIMKALKRTMAGEFSRELGVKVYDGQKRLVGLGFKMGGQPGYGLRRLLVSKDGKKRFYLKSRQQKNLNTDHVLLVRGPDEEVKWVQRVFRMALTKSSIQIAQYLNAREVRYVDGGLWNLNRINGVLTNPKYTGQYVWGRVSVRLHTGKKRHPNDDWCFGPRTFRPIISRALFERVQKARRSRFCRANKLTNEEILQRVRRILDEDGKLTTKRLKSANLSITLLYTRFKNLTNLYKIVGFKSNARFSARIDASYKTRETRTKVMDAILKMYPNDVEMFRFGSVYKPLLVVNKATAFSVQTGIKVQAGKDQYWKFYPRRREIGSMALACLLDHSNRNVEHYYLVRRVKSLGERVRMDSRALVRGIRLNDLSELLTAIKNIKKNRDYSPTRAQVRQNTKTRF